MRAAGVVLAGGASRRMGSPKALLPFEGQTFLDRLIGNFSEVCEQGIVVLGHEPEQIRAGVRTPAKFVVNEQHALGQITSLQCGLRSIDHPVDAVLFTPVDYPAVEPATVRALVEAFEPGYALVVPRYKGRHGHPVLFAGALSFDFLRLPADAAARDVVHAYVSETRYIDVEDPCVIHDVDEPSDYAELLRSRRPR